MDLIANLSLNMFLIYITPIIVFTPQHCCCPQHLTRQVVAGFLHWQNLLTLPSKLMFKKTKNKYFFFIFVYIKMLSTWPLNSDFII